MMPIRFIPVLAISNQLSAISFRTFEEPRTRNYGWFVLTADG